MKFKKKLIVYRDDELFSPQMLIESSNEKKSNKKLNENNLKQENESLTNFKQYFISVNQPKQIEKKEDTEVNQPKQKKKVDFTLSQQTYIRNRTEKMHLDDANQEVNINRQITRMQQAVKSRKDDKKSSCRLFFQNNNILQGLVKSQKVRNIAHNFVKKVRRSSLYYQPVDYDKIKVQKETSFLYLTGFELPVLAECVISLISLLQIFILLIIYTLSIVFQDLMQIYQGLALFQRFSLAFYFFEIVVNFITVKFEAGKKLETIKQIINYYMSHNFLVDIISFLVLLCDISTELNFIFYCRLFILFKLPQCYDKIEKVQVNLIKNIHNQQYWQLAKVFLVNFAYAHIISLILILMANFDPDNNWIISKGLTGSTWIELYVWSFYWATTIMLTVGFGDIVAVNHMQAIVIIFIQTFSCIIMAYNINRVGTIISNIRLQDQNRSRKFKAFKKLSIQNNISQELTFKINNYIEQSSKLKKNFNIEEDKQLLQQLPDNLRITYLREANKEILNKLVFFKTLLDRTLCKFAEKLQTKISHPQEIIRSIDDDFNLIILRKGHIGLICKKQQCKFNNYIADEIKVKDGDSPYLTSLDFISKVRPTYQIQSLRFSVLYTLSYQTFIEVFRESDMDYELYCFLRDKCRNIPDEFQVYNCEYCKTYNHYKFTCPRLHYVPYQQHIINKQLYRQKIGKNPRTIFQRYKNISFKPAEYYKKMKEYQEKVSQKEINSQLLLQPALSKKNSSNLSQVGSKIKRQITSAYLQTLLDQKTKEGIEIQFLKKQNKKRFQDEIWIINLDEMANYNSYFMQDNPKFLKDKFSLEERINKKNKKAKTQPYKQNTFMSVPTYEKLKELTFTSQKQGTFAPHLSIQFM